MMSTSERLHLIFTTTRDLPQAPGTKHGAVRGTVSREGEKVRVHVSAKTNSRTVDRLGFSLILRFFFFATSADFHNTNI